MKPGCFLKSIIILTIIVAAITYIIQHRSELFLEPGRKMITSVFNDDWNEKFNYVKDTPEKVELKNVLKKYLDSLKLKNIPDDKEINKITVMVQKAAADSLISKTELNEISQKLRALQE